MKITTSPHQDVPHFPMACPACGSESGMPFRVQTVTRSMLVNVSMRCRHCSHEWRIAHDTDAAPAAPAT